MSPASRGLHPYTPTGALDPTGDFLPQNPCSYSMWNPKKSLNYIIYYANKAAGMLANIDAAPFVVIASREVVIYGKETSS